MPETPTKFPDGFLWGVSTSGDQYGDNFGGLTDWREFEREMSGNLACCAKDKDYGNGPLPEEIWERVGTTASDPDSYVSGKACEWWDGRWKEDLDRAKDLGINAIRFSIEWARLQPVKDGPLEPIAINHYREVIQGCRDRNIEPIVTLHHFVNPLWVAEDGGWENHKTVDRFTHYAAAVVQSLEGTVNKFIIFNEPDIYTSQGYFVGAWPPQKKSLFSMISVRQNLIEAHSKTYDAIKAIYKKLDKEVKISSTVNLAYVEPKSKRVVDKMGATIFKKLDNGLFLPYMVDKMDFIALNHYMHHVKKGLNPAKNYNENPPDEVRSDLGWYVNPESLYHVLMSLKKYDKPIYIMEHGVADAGDRIRPWLIEETFKWIRKALKDGVDLRSYFHWSLVDNFEWNKGWFPKFGLIELNETTKERTVRQSGIVYSRCIKEAES